MSRIELIATATFGLESVVARELKNLGYEEQTVEDGRVTFIADEAAICRTNLWLRSADRVLVKVGQFEARDFGQLFDGTRALPWSEWLPVDAKFPVSGKSVRSQLHNVPNCQKIVKKAIVESLKQTSSRHWFAETGPEYAVEVGLLRDVATLTIDTSGPGLHKRGYRNLSGPATLKETLAAALVQLSDWTPERPFHDPFCGTGTIPIEAALMARNRAPGLDRNFTCQDWPRITREMWKAAREEARDLQRGKPPVRLVATDINEHVLGQARHHARQASVEFDIHFQQLAVADLRSSRKYGCLVCNPPYGERLGDREQAEALYRQLATVIEPLDTWSTYVLTSHPQFERIIGRPATRRRKLYNGRIECTYYQYFGPRPPAGAAERSEQDGNADAASPPE